MTETTEGPWKILMRVPMTDDIHSCSYECMRPACILRQRDELAARQTLRRFAGWFHEIPTVMSYRLWEQGGHDQTGNEVALYEE